MIGLWNDHAATPRQKSLNGKHTRQRSGKLTQADVLIAMLRDRRTRREALELPAIMKAGIAQHGARFNELRAKGFVIKNELEHIEGATCSRYWLTFDPECEAR